jgi:hypothetical protein
MLVTVVLLTTSLQGMEKGVAMAGQRFLPGCALIALLSLVVANVGPFGNVCAQGKKQGASPPQPTKKNVAFEDKFDRDDLGEMYDILDPDPNRLTLNDGKLLIVATEPRKNLILLRQTFSSDFVASVAVTMAVTENNTVRLLYWVMRRTTSPSGFGVKTSRRISRAKDDSRHSLKWSMGNRTRSSHAGLNLARGSCYISLHVQSSGTSSFSGRGANIRAE